MPYTPETLTQLLKDERKWADRVFAKISEDLLDWPIPDTPYTVSWLLWHLGESHHWVNHAVLQMKKEDGTPIGYPPWERGKKTLKEYIRDYKDQSQDLEKTVSHMTTEQLNTPQKYLSMWGEITIPVGQIITNSVFHIIGHLNVISFARGLRGRIQGEKQKWPPY
ncbi:MAG: DinB family protein [Candidatus Ranarchaeia archaeon]